MTSHPLAAWEEREIRTDAPGPSGLLTRWNAAIRGVLLPFKAPTASPLTDADARLWWRIVCVLSVLPVAALLHYGVFHRPTCMLNNFGHEYTPAVVATWLKADPSLPWAIAAMVAVHWIGARMLLARALVAPGFITGLLFTLWIWDVPFTGRVVCDHFHDKGFFIASGVALGTKHIAGVCAVMYVLSQLAVFPRFMGSAARPRPEDAPLPDPALAAMAGGGRVAAAPVLAGAGYPRARLVPEARD